MIGYQSLTVSPLRSYAEEADTLSIIALAATRSKTRMETDNYVHVYGQLDGLATVQTAFLLALSLW